MCGIAGIYNFNGLQLKYNELKKMTDIIEHRGPDGHGHWINEKSCIGFGHRRLSIIDLSDNGKQPMHYKDGRYTITFNGEIYNYIELKSELIKNNYEFFSDSDTEVLLALYDLKKEKCLEDLDGMFAFAIWDELEQSLFCARDRFGEKPFHFYLDDSKFVFASEIKQLWAQGIERRVDNEKMMFYINSGVIDGPEYPESTFYKGVKRLDAGHYLKIDALKKITIKCYWDIDMNRVKFSGTIEEAAEKFLEIFTNSIRLRLRSDVPVGSSLSGGLDSSSIVMLIDLLKGKELKQNTFSARFENFVKDEGTYVKTVVEACRNLEVHYAWPDGQYFENVFENVVYHQDEPFTSTSIVAQYAVMELAKKNNVTVLLDGQGADEYIGGYLSQYNVYLNQLFYHNKNRYIKEYDSYSKYHNKVYPSIDLMHNESIRMKLGRYKRYFLRQEMPERENALMEKLKYDTKIDGLKTLLRYADRNSMAHSREVRLPFLDHKLVEFVFSLPDNFKLNEGWTKFILRKAMNNILPKEICWRRDKIGYETPQNIWLNSKKVKDDITKATNYFNIKEPSQTDDISKLNLNWRLLVAHKYI